MTDGQVLEFSRATKRFGTVTAVDDLSARIEPGAVTAFLGPNGAGKTTSLRLLLGQIRATSGTATIGGVSHAEIRHPLRTVGSVLEEAVYRPRRTAPRQLTIAAKANGIPLSRVDEVLALVGLQNETETRIGAYSLGMRQRLSVAGALLGDPGALVLDEPANGLDPEGIRWMRLLMRRLADEGRTVLVSSHVLSEIEQVADNVLVLSKGRLVYADSIGKLSDPTTGSVVVDADDRAALATALQNAGLSFDVLRSGLTVHNTDTGAVGAAAAAAGLALTALQQRGPSLEEVFLDLVHGRRSPATGAVPIIAAPVPVADENAAARTGDVPVEGAIDNQGGSEAASAESGAGAGAAGLFGAAAAVPVVAAAGAGAAGLFGEGRQPAAEAGTVAIPTTRRAAAEFAAAQSAQDNALGAGDEDPGEGAAAPADDDRAEAETEGDAAAESEGEPAAESERKQADVEGEQDDAEGDGEQDASTPLDEAGSDESPAENTDETGSEEPPVTDGAEDAPAEADERALTDDESPSDGPDDAPQDDQTADDADADESMADDAAAQAEAEQTEDGESSAIAAGVALTAPIVADYTPGEADADNAAAAEDSDDADTDDHAAAQDSLLTHPADDSDETAAQGPALGSFETAALTIPDQAHAVSFDDLITGIPSAVTSGMDDGETADRPAAPEQGVDLDNTPTAATTVITTPPADDEFAVPEPTTETTEIAGIEIFAALADGRTQEIQVILDESPEEDDDIEDVTQGEIDQDEDPRAAAVSASLAAAARAFFTDEAPSYTPGPVETEQAAEATDGDEQHDDAQSAAGDAQSAAGDAQSAAGDAQPGDAQAQHDEGESEQQHQGEHHGH